MAMDTYDKLLAYVHANASTPLEVAKTLVAWEWASMLPGQPPSSQNPRTIADNMHASCSERMILTTALMKEIGIQSRTVNFYDVPFQGGHTCMEMNIHGQWMFFDPTFGLYFAPTVGGTPMSVESARADWPHVVVEQANLPGWQNTFVDLSSINPTTSFSPVSGSLLYEPTSFSHVPNVVGGEVNSLYFGPEDAYFPSNVAVPSNGFTWRTYDDTTDAYAWSEITDRYDARGRLDFETGINDDGSHWFIDYDQFQDENWSAITTRVAPDSELASIFTVYDNGTRTQVTNRHDAVVPVGSANASLTSHLYAGYGTETMLGGSGNDRLISDAVATELDGRDGNDVIAGGPGSELIMGDAGNDLVYAGGGRDTLNGGDGDDGLIGGSGFCSISGGSGNDYAYVYAGGGIVFGGDGNDQAYAGSGTVSFHGDAGNDSLYGGSGADALDGGVGNDLMMGGAGNDLVTGGAGNDIAYAGNGLDSMYGGAGDDALVGGVGHDLLEGGDGNDWLYVYSGGGLLYGGAGNDVEVGNLNADVLIGDAGDDYSFGYGGNDYAYGGDGNDTMLGGDGVDVLIGGAGNDYFDGGTGVNYYFGGNGGGPGTGLGNDIFALNANPSTQSIQVVQDWTEGSDSVLLTGTGFTSFSDLLAHSYQNGAYFVIQPSADNAVWLNGATAASVSAGDFAIAS